MSLQDKCMETIVRSVMQAPPMIREMITNEISVEMSKEKKQRIIAGTISDTCHINLWLVPKVVRNILISGYNVPLNIDDIYTIHQEFREVDKNIMDTAITIAEDTITITKSHSPRYYFPRGDSDSESESESAFYHESDY